MNPIQEIVKIRCAKAVLLTSLINEQWEQSNHPRHFTFNPCAKKPISENGKQTVGSFLNEFEKNYALIWGKLRLFQILPLLSLLPLKIKEPFCILLKRPTDKGENEIYVAFRGTQTPLDWRNNLEIAQKKHHISGFGSVHSGFYEIYLSLKDDLMQQLAKLIDDKTQTIYVTGHSLGGALATLATLDINKQYPNIEIEHISFASPSLGCPEFARAYNALGIPTVRIANLCDDVPAVPLPADLIFKLFYQHINELVHFSVNHESIFANHDMDKTYLYYLLNPIAPVNPALSTAKDTRSSDKRYHYLKRSTERMKIFSSQLFHKSNY